MKKTALSEITRIPEKALKIIADNMIKIRPECDVEYIPYKKSKICRDEAPLNNRCIDLSKLYPHAEDKEQAAVGTILYAQQSYDMALYTEGRVKAVLNGKIIADEREAECTDMKITDIHLNKGRNELIFFCKKAKNDFSFKYMAAVPPYYMWAKDYIAHVRSLVPIDEYENEEGVGISRLFKNESDFDGVYVYPPPTEPLNNINFGDVYGQEGKIAFAYTNAAEDTVLKLNGAEGVFVNGKKAALEKEIKLIKGDEILVKAYACKSVSYNSDAKIRPLILNTKRINGSKWLLLGCFDKSIKTGPQFRVDFKTAYIGSGNSKLFWRTENGDFVRPYISSCFYSQWFYALMVGHLGLLDTGRYLGEEKYVDYFYKSIKNISDYFDYMRYEAEEFGQTSFLQKSHELDNLDETGTMGMNLCEQYKLCPSPETRHCIDVLADAVVNNVMRFEDGAFRRPDTMWADDTYMSCPFLVRLGNITGENKYYKECVRQFMGFKKRLYMPEKKLFSHIYFTETKKINKVPWGRGNGWVINALSDVLINLPRETDGYEDLLKLYKELAEGIKKCCDENGLWHQVLDRKDSYTETSCSGMFLLAFARGVNNGWLGKEYADIADRAYNAIINEKVDSEGNVYDVCKGSSRSMDAKYYMELGTIDNDDHGTGIILSAICEYGKMKNSEEECL